MRSMKNAMKAKVALMATYYHDKESPEPNTSGLSRKEKVLKKLTLHEKKTVETDSKNFLIDPTNDMKINWDIFITAVLLFSCIVTPVQIAVFDELD